MTKPIHLYVSSSPELSVEREIIGHVVAQVPVTLGWRIGHTPHVGDFEENTTLWVEECDLYTLILGQDFSAPMGNELRKVINKGTMPLAYLKNVTLSPSGLNTLHHVPLRWQKYTTLAQFRRLFTKDLLSALIEHIRKLDLEWIDLAGIVHMYQLLESEDIEHDEAYTSSIHDAGASGVILGREVIRN